jgi:hypothetical protein
MHQPPSRRSCYAPPPKVRVSLAHPRHCPELSTITLARLDCKLSLALTSCLSSCRLASLTSLALTASNHGESLPLTPVGELSSLTALTVIGRADVASAAWLPPGLRRLQLGALDLEHPGIGGTSWLDAIGACRGLEVLELSWLDGLDLGPEPDHPDDEFDFTKFYSSIGQVGDHMAQTCLNQRWVLATDRSQPAACQDAPG